MILGAGCGTLAVGVTGSGSEASDMVSSPPGGGAGAVFFLIWIMRFRGVGSGPGTGFRSSVA